MELWIGLDTEQFATRAGAFIEAGIERNVLATVFASVIAGRHRDAIFGVICDEHDETVAAAIRTPPYNMLISGEVADPDAFIATWMGLDPRPAGISGEPTLSRAIADAWVRTTQGRVEPQLTEGLYVLGELIAPDPPVPGRLRRADFRQSAQMGEWGIAFATDANLPNPAEAAVGIEHQLTQQRLYLWEVDGGPVSLIGHNVEIGGTVRIGPVYTPRELRGRGYAGAATAALCRQLLDAGTERCILYADLANPISNHVYSKIGFVQVSQWEEIAFDVAAG